MNRKERRRHARALKSRCQKNCSTRKGNKDKAHKKTSAHTVGNTKA